jgi:Na+/melibiose symporter-like transporter
LTDRRLSVPAKLTYGLGELSLTTSMTALTMVYAYFLLQEAGLRPVLAGLVPLIGRFVDAISDPLMGRLSDRSTRWEAGRRRPYFLLGAIPYGLSFFAIWWDPPFAGQAARFAYYALAYSVFSLALTVLYVPYLSLLPEMAKGYDERTSLNAYRSAVGTLGMLAAISLRLVAEALGGATADFASAAAIYALLLTLPWIAVYRVTFEPERAALPREKRRPLFEGFADVAKQPSFRRLCLIYLMGRMGMDIAGALFILYAKFWLGRVDDFEIVMLIFFAGILVSFPLADRLAQRREKARLYAVGAIWWALVGSSLLFVQPEWPRWLFFLLVPLITPGFALVDLMPWSMVGEAADEGELASGERRDGVYNGVLSFVRKFGGAVGLFLVLGFLDWMGFVEGSDEQTEQARQAVRLVMAFGPGIPLAIGAWLALRYPLRRADHARIRRELDARS